MTSEDFATLIRLVKAMCPAQKFDEYTPDAWFMVLGDLEFADCKTVLPEVAKATAFIAPKDIALAVKRLRAERINAANLIYEPYPGESVIDFQVRLLAQQRAAASGQIPAGRPTLALPPGTSPASVPLAIGQIVESVRAQRRHPALAVQCPWCHAPADRWCEKYTGRSRPERSKRGFLHPSRCEEAGVRHVPEIPAERREEAERLAKLADTLETTS